MLAVEFDDDVAALQSGLVGRRIGPHLIDEHAALRLAARLGRPHVADRHADRGATSRQNAQLAIPPVRAIISLSVDGRRGRDGDDTDTGKHDQKREDLEQSHHVASSLLRARPHSRSREPQALNIQSDEGHPRKVG